MNSVEDAKVLSDLLINARYKSGKSQEYMAMGLNVSKNTVYNWEKGTSSPSIRQFIQWYKLLNLNPTADLFKLCNPSECHGIKSSDSDEKIESALQTVISNLPIDKKRQILYLILGEHGSDPNSVLEMITADLHCPMYNRVNIAQTILDNYEIAEQSGRLVDTEHILPDIDKLKYATAAGKKAAIQGTNSYNG